jgi:hypothetical protein
MISFQISLLQGMGWPIAAELSSLRLRAKTMSIAIIVQTLSTCMYQPFITPANVNTDFLTGLTTFIMPYIYNVDVGNLGARTGFIFAGTSILLFAGT